MRRSRISALVGLGLVAALVTGCRDDESSDASGDLDRYCELVGKLDAAGSEAFEALETDDSATDEDFERAERQFIEDHREVLDDLRDVAPDEIADDVDVLLTAQQARAAGGEQEQPSGDAEAAEERIREFEGENCPGGR